MTGQSFKNTPTIKIHDSQNGHCSSGKTQALHTSIAEKRSLSHSPLWTLEPLSLPSWDKDRDSRLPGPHSPTIWCRRPRVRGLSTLSWTLPQQTYLLSLFFKGAQRNRDLRLADRAQLLCSLRKHGLCHLLWETHSGSHLHTVSLVYIHLTKHANIMYSFGPWGLLIQKKINK